MVCLVLLAPTSEVLALRVCLTALRADALPLCSCVLVSRVSFWGPLSGFLGFPGFLVLGFLPSRSPPLVVSPAAYVSLQTDHAAFDRVCCFFPGALELKLCLGAKVLDAQTQKPMLNVSVVISPLANRSNILASLMTDQAWGACGNPVCGPG